MYNKKLYLESIEKQYILQHTLKLMFNHFGGNPHVLQLLQSPDTEIQKLLEIDSFPAQFRTCNPKLQKYMDISKYNKLIQFITQVGDPNNRNRAYKYPLAAAEILSIDNKETIDAIFKQGKIIIEKIQTEERWVQKEVDECDSEYCSSQGSHNSGRNAQQFFQMNERENIPPQNGQLKQQNILSIDSKKKSQKNSDGDSKGRRSLGASSASITSDDFPFVQQAAKKIKVKQIITRKVEVQIKPLLQQLCQFFQKQINYTLTGYVIKVFQMLFKKNPRRIIRQLFTTKVHKSLIKHIQSQLACDFIVNMLLCTENEAQNAREYLISAFLKNLINYADNESMMIYNKSILYILVQLNSRLDPQESKWNTILFEYLYQQPSFSKISDLIFNYKGTTNKNKQFFCQILIQYIKKLINPIIINASNTAQSSMKTSQQQSIKQLRKRMLTKFETCFKNFIDRLWENLLQLSQKQMPSYVYIKQLEILNILIKNDINWSRMQLSNQENILSPLLQLCQKYNKNNFIHNQIFDLLKEIVHISNDTPALFKKTFQNKQFLNFCLETISENGVINNTMYRGQCTYLCQAIRHNTSQAVTELKKQFKLKWTKIQQLLLLNVEKINSTLGGFSVKRPHKAQIHFSKQDIMKKFDYFLKGQLPLKKTKSLQQQELTDINSQNNSQWNDWNQFNNYSADEVDQKNGKTYKNQNNIEN